jgi:hypothetical protein
VQRLRSVRAKRTALLAGRDRRPAGHRAHGAEADRGHRGAGRGR